MKKRAHLSVRPLPPKRVKRQQAGKQAYLLGVWAEYLCLLFLWLKGYRLVARRLRTPFGEIDLVVTRGDVLAFVEVKARPTSSAAAEALGAAQQQRLIRAAAFVTARYPAHQNKTLRFDLMIVPRSHWPLHLPNAWDASH